VLSHGDISLGASSLVAFEFGAFLPALLKATMDDFNEAGGDVYVCI
jgi:hypothetical protein